MHGTAVRAASDRRTGWYLWKSAYAGSGLEPKIEVTNNAFKITLPNRNAVVSADTASSEAESNEERILEFLRTHGVLVRSDVDRLLNVSQSTASRILRGMVKNGILYQEGTGRKTKYKKK